VGQVRLSNAAYGNTSEVTAYDYILTTVESPAGQSYLSDTLTFYGQQYTYGGCTAYPSGTYIYDTPCSKSTKGSGRGSVAQTQITYSNTGHPTKTLKWTSGNAWLTSTATYSSSNGTLQIAYDVNGTPSTYGYGTGGCNGLLPTSVTVAGSGVNLSTTMQWDCNGAVVTSQTDANGQPTTTHYTLNGVADPLYRPLSVVDPLTNTTTLSYSPITSESAMNFNGTISTTDALVTTDGLGRDIFTQKRQGQGSSTFDTTQTGYGWNSIGVVTTQSMPYASTQAEGAVTTTQYDALGRPLTVTDGGGGVTSYQYLQNYVIQTVGPTQTFQKQLQYDGLGRLISVCEITSASGSGACGNSKTGFLTQYTYDALGNLLTVTQNAQPGATQQTRTYTYDGLSRLTSERNPEWGPGTATYTYDVACSPYPASIGDMTTKLDAAGNTTCYLYDGLHRLTDAGNGTTTCRHLRYDNNVTPPTGITVSMTEARLEEAYTDACSGSKVTDEWFGYDADGRMTDVYESTPDSGTPYYHTSSCYWPNGTIESLSGIPGVPAIYYGNSTCTNSGNGLDGEGRVTQVSAANGTSPASSITYSSATTSTALTGSLTGVSFTSGDSDGFSYDPNTGRQTGYTFSVNGATDSGTLYWNQNGTLGTLQIVDQLSFSADSETCKYFYDALGRLGGVDSNGYSVDCGSTWSQLFAFDPFGNITKSGSLTFLPTYSPTTNRYTLSGVNVQYDLNGNLLTDNLNTYTWDPSFGNPKSVNGINLVYDALGRMVEQQSGTNMEILYSPAGKTALMNGQTLTRAFIGVPGGGTAIYNSVGLAYYRHPDWLGSSRLTSTVTPPTTGYPTTAYAPFGEQYGSDSPQSDASFTVYDFTYREYSPSQGRWVSPDPSGLGAVDPTNPQSWNRYAYALNNPLSYIDPTGLGDCPSDTGGQTNINDSTADALSPDVKNDDQGARGAADCAEIARQVQNTTTSSLLNKFKNYFSSDPCGDNQDYCVSVNVNSIPVDTNTSILTWGLNFTKSFFAANNGVTATISAGPPDAKKNYCLHQSNMAGLEAVLPGGNVLMGNDYSPSAVLGSTAEIASHVGPEVAAGSYGLLYTIRSYTGIPMSIAKGFFEVVGYAAVAVTGYSALSASQKEYQACMSN